MCAPSQQKWISKLLGYHFKISYKQGSLNKAADALSRRNEGHAELLVLTVSSLTMGIIEEVMQAYKRDQRIQKVLRQMKEGVSCY